MDQPVYPQKELASGNTDFNQMSFVIKAALAKLNVATLVQVVAVHPGAGLLVGFVDVTPLVNQVDGGGAAVPHGTIFGVPFFRVQGGANAVICDPAAGDIGFALFADRDLSSVKSTGAVANPGSARRFDLADALYFGGWNMAVQPTAYVQVTQAGINLVLPGTSIALTPGLCTVNAAATKINGTLEVTGNATFDAQTESKGLLLADASMQVTGTVSGPGGGGNFTISVPVIANSSITATGEVKSGSHTLTAHTHSGVTTGGGTTGGPTG
jgi:hypothetical protein